MLEHAAERIQGPWAVKLDGTRYRYDLASGDGKQRTRWELDARFSLATLSQARRWQTEVRAQIEAETALPPNEFARPDDVREAARSPSLAIGARTSSHPNLAVCSQPELQDEIGGRREKLQAWTGQDVSWFAYPFGRCEHWNETVVRAVQSAGFEGAVTTIPGYVGSRSDRYRVPRLVVQAGWDMDTFKTRVLHATLYRHGQRLKRSLGRLGA